MGDACVREFFFFEGRRGDDFSGISVFIRGRLMSVAVSSLRFEEIILCS